MVEVVTFARTLTHTGEHRQTAVLFSDVVNEFHHVHGLTYTRTTEQTDLTAFSERTHQVNHFDARLKQLN